MSLKRFSNIAHVLTEEGFDYILESAPKLTPQNEVMIATRLRRICEKLGPTFIKFGQVLSMRRDLFSDGFCDELAKLQSSVSAFPSEVAIQIIESELQTKIDNIFNHFEMKPVAAASIAQVHFAQLKTGEAVAIKVQRPKAQETVRDDLDMILSLSKWLDRLFSTYREAMVHSVAQSFISMTLKELNFLEEATVAEELKLALSNISEVYIPKIYREFSSSRVLVEERLYGVRLDTLKDETSARAQGFDTRQIAITMLKLQVRQSYDVGILHADMHPGNIILMDGGRIGLIDFGMCVRVPKDLRDKMRRMLRLRASGRYEECIDAFLNIFKVPVGSDILTLKKELIEFARINDKKPLNEMSIGKALIEESRLGQKYGLTAPPELILVMRGVLIVEGIALKLCPTLSVYTELKHVLEHMMREKFTSRYMLDTWSELIPDFLESFEMTPEVSKTFFRLRHNISSSRNLAEFLSNEGITLSDKQASKNQNILVSIIVIMAGVVGYLIARI